MVDSIRDPMIVLWTAIIDPGNGNPPVPEFFHRSVWRLRQRRFLNRKKTRICQFLSLKWYVYTI